MTTIKAMRLASLVTAINVLVASGFTIAAIFRPEVVVPAGSIPTEASLLLAMYGAARIIPLALFTLAAIYKRVTSALLILGTLAGPPVPRSLSASAIHTDSASIYAWMNTLPDTFKSAPV